MKKFASLALIAAVMALSACASKGSADYGYETNAPYGSERTVGAQKTQAKKATKVYKSSQAK